MRIEKDINFKGRIKLEEQINSKDKFLRYSINHLKHHCGGANVEHSILYSEADRDLMVTTKFFPKNGAYSFNFLKRLDLASKEKIDSQLKEINDWLKRMRKFKLSFLD